MTTDGALHASQGQEAVLDPHTGQLAIPLTCGEFTFNDHQPFYVEWEVRGNSIYNHEFSMSFQ
jgi:hypothetical protein